MGEFRGRGGSMPPEIIAIGEPMLEFNAIQEGSLAEVEEFNVVEDQNG